MLPFRDSEGNRHRTKEGRDAFNARLEATKRAETTRAKLDRIEKKLDRLLQYHISGRV